VNQDDVIDKDAATLAELAGPDPSMGRSKKLFNVNVTIKYELCDAFCSPGLDVDTQNRLLDVMLDAMALSGAVTTASNEGDLSPLTQAMVMMNQSQAHDKSGTRDLQWRSSS